MTVKITLEFPQADQALAALELLTTTFRAQTPSEKAADPQPAVRRGRKPAASAAPPAAAAAPDPATEKATAPATSPSEDEDFFADDPQPAQAVKEIDPGVLRSKLVELQTAVGSKAPSVALLKKYSPEGLFSKVPVEKRAALIKEADAQIAAAKK